MNNEPAFPTYHGGNSKCSTDGCGMTLRDYFAAQALAGIQIWDSVLNGKNALFTAERGGVELLAKIAYQVADALIEQREETK